MSRVIHLAYKITIIDHSFRHICKICTIPVIVIVTVIRARAAGSTKSSNEDIDDACTLSIITTIYATINNNNNTSPAGRAMPSANIIINTTDQFKIQIFNYILTLQHPDRHSSCFNWQKLLFIFLPCSPAYILLYTYIIITIIIIIVDGVYTIAHLLPLIDDQIMPYGAARSQSLAHTTLHDTIHDHRPPPPPPHGIIEH